MVYSLLFRSDNIVCTSYGERNGRAMPRLVDLIEEDYKTVLYDFL